MIVGQVLLLLAVAFVCYCNGDQETCLRFGGGGCCPVVDPTDRTLQQVRFSLGPISRLLCNKERFITLYLKKERVKYVRETQTQMLYTFP